MAIFQRFLNKKLGRRNPTYPPTLGRRNPTYPNISNKKRTRILNSNPL